MALVKEAQAHSNIRAVKLPWGDIIHTFLWRGQPHVFAKDIADKLGMVWEQEEMAITMSLGIPYITINPQELGLNIDSDDEHIALDLPSLHGYLFSIRNETIEDMDLLAHINLYKQECMRALDRYWRFGKAVNPAFYINQKCKELSETGMMDLAPAVDMDKNVNYIRCIHRAALLTSIDKSALEAAVLAADTASMSGMNDVVNFVKALKPVATEAIRSKNVIDRMLVALVDSDHSAYLQDCLGEYLTNELIEDRRNNIFRGTRTELRTETQLEVILFSTIENAIADFLIDMMDRDIVALVLGEDEAE